MLSSKTGKQKARVSSDMSYKQLSGIYKMNSAAWADDYG